jgi:anti-anti-sigma factor
MVESFAIVPYGPNTYFLGGELDMATAPRLEEAVQPCIDAGGPILFDLSAVSFVDSSGLRAFLSMARKLGSKGCVLLHAPQERIRRLIELVRLTDVENIHVESCALIAHPESYIDWTPPSDLAERFAELRQYAVDTA